MTTKASLAVYRSALGAEAINDHALARIEVVARACRHQAKQGFEREHVTPWIRRNKPRRSFVQEQDLASLRWTIDYPEDYQFLSDVFADLQDGARCFGARDVYRWLLDHPDKLWTDARRPLADDVRRDLLLRIRAQLESDRSSS